MEEIEIFAHRGSGVTDIGPQDAPDAKGDNLKNIPPENSFEAIEAAFKNGYSVEVDVTMTADGRVIVTHTNDLSRHSPEARKLYEETNKRCFVSEMTFDEISRMQTGLGGRTAPFLTYEAFLELLERYPAVKANIEIKGTIQEEPLMAELQNPSLIDQLVKLTPASLRNRIVWSSFANSNIVEMKKRLPDAEAAQLFAEPGRLMEKGGEDPVYPPPSKDRYVQFTKENLEKLGCGPEGIAAAHPCIDSLMTEEGSAAVQYCAEKHIAIRTWALLEKDPGKDFPASLEAKQKILQVVEFKKKYPSLKIDIITDYPEAVEGLLLAADPRIVCSGKAHRTNGGEPKETSSFSLN